MPSVEEQIAWAAGLFEGEGWFSRHRGKNKQTGTVYVRPVACIRSTDRDVIERFRDVMGRGSVTRINKGPGNKTQWHWSVTGYSGVGRLYDLFGPWLGERRQSQYKRVMEEGAQHRQLRLAVGGEDHPLAH